MKKLFHLGMIALIGLSISSCSKSATDLVAKEQAAKANTESSQQKKTASLKLSNHHVNRFDPLPYASEIYPYINQPVDMHLGDPNSTLTTGDNTAFYVILSGDIADLTPTSGTLTTSDDATGEVIATYNLIYYKDLGPLTIAVKVPAELSGVPFMVAVVNIDDQYTNRSVSLSSFIQFDNGSTSASLNQAFNVIP